MGNRVEPYTGAVIPGGMAASPVSPSLRDIERAICCPSGKCMAPNDCYANDRSRSYPVHIRDAAAAVAKMIQQRWDATTLDGASLKNLSLIHEETHQAQQSQTGSEKAAPAPG